MVHACIHSYYTYTYKNTYAVMKGKKCTISTYLDEIGDSIEKINDEGILDHTIAKLLPVVMSLRTHSTQPSDDGDDFEDFDATEKFALAQKTKFS